MAARFDNLRPSRITRLMAISTSSGEWFMLDAQRDASSDLASDAIRVRPDAPKELYQIKTARVLAAVATTWAMIVMTIALALWSHSAIVWLLAIFVVARCQDELMVLAHNAAHFCLLENRFWNDFIGHWICFFPFGSSLEGYRRIHLRHHRYLYTDEDPDPSHTAPASAAGWRKLLRDISGISELEMRGYIELKNGRWQLARGPMLRDFTPAAIARRLAFAGFLATLFYFGYFTAFIVLWVIPQMMVFVIARIRPALTHGGVADPNDGLRNLRAIVSRNPLLRFVMNRQYLAYHLEHHLFPEVPHYNLAKLHLALTTDPRYERALMDHAYSEANRDTVKNR
jgi:fatty acid desaturase